MAEVTFSIDNEGLPIHKDATVTIRPRLFLEGNFFLDLRPGSPNAPDLSSGGDIPVSQTATAVQLDQILTSLQKGNRTDLKQALAGYGGALTHKPTPAEDKTQVALSPRLDRRDRPSIRRSSTAARPDAPRRSSTRRSWVSSPTTSPT